MIPPKRFLTGSMRQRVKYFIVTVIVFCFSAFNVVAQDETLDTKMNDVLRSGNKFYAVVAVLVTIFTALFGYLIYQDYKLNRIQKDLNSKSSNNNEQNRNA